MRKFVLVLMILISGVWSWSQTTQKVLFIGNSYTYYNDLPNLVAGLASDDGNILQSDQNTPGGYTLASHAANTTTLGKIEQEEWDFVVLQEQSQRPSFPVVQVEQDVYPFASALVDSIYHNDECSVPLFFNTWGRRDGDPQWDSINTFEKMNWRLHKAYQHMTETHEGMISPVGVGFLHVFRDGSAPFTFNDLYVADGSHPSIYGSYLAACIFYNVIFDTISSGNGYLPTGVTNMEATYIQGVADHVVYDVDSVQVDYGALTKNTFTTNSNGVEVTFTANIQNGNFVSWSFGDGTSSSVLNTSHTYAGPGSYHVTMTTSNSCKTHIVGEEIILGSFSGFLKDQQDEFQVFPNPSSDGKINIRGLDKGASYEVYDLKGNLIQKSSRSSIHLNTGVYILKLGEKTKKVVVP